MIGLTYEQMLAKSISEYMCVASRVLNNPGTAPFLIPELVYT
jgi:hypothetical protein